MLHRIMNVKRKFFYWLADDVFCVPHGEFLPKALRFLAWILFPYESLMLRNKILNFDPAEATFTIYGMKYSAQLFRDWADGGIPQGKYFTVVKRENGVIMLQDFIPPSDAELVADARKLKGEGRISSLSDFLEGYDYAMKLLQSRK